MLRPSSPGLSRTRSGIPPVAGEQALHPVWCGVARLRKLPAGGLALHRAGQPFQIIQCTAGSGREPPRNAFVYRRSPHDHRAMLAHTYLSVPSNISTAGTSILPGRKGGCCSTRAGRQLIPMISAPSFFASAAQKARLVWVESNWLISSNGLWSWSRRRRHQARARRCHYQRRLTNLRHCSTRE